MSKLRNFYLKTAEMALEKKKYETARFFYKKAKSITGLVKLINASEMIADIATKVKVKYNANQSYYTLTGISYDSHIGI
jgi:hypothetical protein